MKKIHAATIFLVLVLTACTISWQRPVGKNAKVLNSELTLEVALYSDVQDPDAFQQAVSKAWKQKHPDIGLRFTDWDCYSSDPDQKLDVFVFDAIYLSSFVAEGYLLPIPEEKIQNKEDLFPFALEGCRCDGKL